MHSGACNGGRIVAARVAGRPEVPPLPSLAWARAHSARASPRLSWRAPLGAETPALREVTPLGVDVSALAVDRGDNETKAAAPSAMAETRRAPCVMATSLQMGGAARRGKPPSPSSSRERASRPDVPLEGSAERNCGVDQRASGGSMAARSRMSASVTLLTSVRRRAHARRRRSRPCGRRQSRRSGRRRSRPCGRSFRPPKWPPPSRPSASAEAAHVAEVAAHVAAAKVPPAKPWPWTVAEADSRRRSLPP